MCLVRDWEKWANGETQSGEVVHSALNCPVSLLTDTKLLLLVAVNFLNLLKPAVCIQTSSMQFSVTWLTVIYAVLKIQGDSKHAADVI